MMRMVPKRSCLIWDGELIQERISGNNWALRNSNRTICKVSPFLEYSMPMLVVFDNVEKNEIGILSSTFTYNTRASKHGGVRQLIDHIEIKLVALGCSVHES